jgi:hypothetical protein
MGRIFASLAGATAVVVLLLFGAANASASLSDVPTPTVTGPIADTADSTPWSATDKPLGDYGYVEDEYKYSGDAFQYDTSGAIDQTGTKLTTGGPADDGKYPFKTRMIVRRPADPADFNGTVVVEWLNVTAGFDLEANWFGDPEYLLKHGYAYVGITAQRVGVNWLRGWDAGRYGDLDVSARDNGTETITNDALSYDIYGSGIKALLDGGTGVDPLGNLPKPETVIASGESQSGSRLSTYYNKVQPIHDVVDAFLITVSTGPLRDDGTTPAIRVLSETENRTPKTEPDTADYRQWEVAGGSHLPRMAFENFQKPIERDTGLTLSASCVKYPLSRVQWPFVVNSAYEHLVDWANGGAAPPIAPRGDYQDAPADPANQLERDDNGVAQGAIRLPEVSVPVRLNTGINSADPGGGGIFSAFCTLLGSSEDLSNAVLKNTYEDWGDYIDQVSAKAHEVADQGFILDEDVPRLIDQHKQVYTLRPTKPERSGKKRPSDRKFKLSWQGSTAPDTSFRLEHSRDGGETWSAVKGADELGKPKFKINEKPGTWIYKVRSTTVVPADAARPSFTVTTPFSKRSTKATVNR